MARGYRVVIHYHKVLFSHQGILTSFQQVGDCGVGDCHADIFRVVLIVRCAIREGVILSENGAGCGKCLMMFIRQGR